MPRLHSDPVPDSTDIICIGAGPAGLTAAHLLSKAGRRVAVLEKDPCYVGGISRTVEYKGYLFDIGGHRFFSRSREIENLWTELLPEDMLTRRRLSRIYYDGKFFAYPLTPLSTLSGLGPVNLVHCILSYAKARLFPYRSPANFEEWIVNHFGRRLYSIFFKTYTEKVWGINCTEIAPEWAAQRIKGLDLGSAIRNAFRPRSRTNRARRDSDVIKTLIHTFRYPRKGPGMMWEAAVRAIRDHAGQVSLGCTVTGLEYDSGTSKWTATYQAMNGGQARITANHVISSAPIREIIEALRPVPGEEVLAAASSLRYRDFLIVALIIDEPEVFEDNWIYIHDPGIKATRVQNFKSWSPDMVPDAGRTCLGVEYCCFKGDGLWNTPDHDLIALAAGELSRLGLISGERIVDGCVVRQEKAYPVYTDNYKAHVDTIRTAMREHYPRLHLIGRNGMHKYNNQDHAMMTAMLTARNILDGDDRYDVWQVNEDAQYHESGEAGQNHAITGRLVPQRIPSGSPRS